MRTLMHHRALTLLPRHALLMLAGLALAPTAFAQDDVDLSDILGEDKPAEESTVAEERAALEAQAEREAQAAQVQQVELAPPKHKVIKTLQPKYFLKIGRGEFTPFVGMVTNEPLIRRIMFGGNLGYHLTEVLELELSGMYSPTFGKDGAGDYKSVTKQIIEQNDVSPKISRLVAYATLNLNYSPFYGKIATRNGKAILFDLYAAFGLGMAYSIDDIKVLGNEDQAISIATQKQAHPAIQFGGGLRVSFTRTFGLRLDVRNTSFINTFESLSLEVKNDLGVTLGASIFLGRKRP